MSSASVGDLRRSPRKMTLILLVMLGIFPGVASAAASFDEFARNCGVSATVRTRRLFSDNDNDKNRWKEYSTPKQIPENNEWWEAAYAWGTSGSPAVIDVEGVGEDFADSSYYCFDASGKLSSLEHEFRTAWGWGYAERRDYDKGGKETSKSHFFDIKSRNQIPRPDGADDVKEAMTTRAYLRLPELPFFSLFAPGSKPK